MEQIHGYDYKADIWSLGITALELAKGYAPYAKYPPMKVLILTIQEDPPSLDTYDEEDGGDDDDDLLDSCDEEFTKSFRSFVDACLQKNPTKRPKCTDMLQSKPIVAFEDPAYRETRRLAIAREVCDLVEDVGNPDTATSSGGQPKNGSALPNNTPVSIVLSQEDNNRQAGTTWVFADGSQVISSSARSPSTVDDVLDEMDQFGMETGGEHYSRNQVQVPARARAETASSHHDEPDDLNAFMDEFELKTQGENFRHPSN
jgi:serine/threonine-protein kinase OSR1/STK39